MNKPIYKHLYWSSLILKLKAGWFLAATIYIYIWKKFKRCIWVLYKMNLYFLLKYFNFERNVVWQPHLNNSIIPFLELKLIYKWIGRIDINILIVQEHLYQYSLSSNNISRIQDGLLNYFPSITLIILCNVFCMQYILCTYMGPKPIYYPKLS